MSMQKQVNGFTSFRKPDASGEGDRSAYTRMLLHRYRLVGNQIVWMGRTFQEAAYGIVLESTLRYATAD